MSRSADLLREAAVTVLFSGHLRPANATWGAAASAAILAGMAAGLAAGGASRWVLDAVVIPVGVLAACVLSIQLGAWAIRRFGREDPRPFVLDEFAGQWIALALMPGATLSDDWTYFGWFATQWLLFRFFDVSKLPPARQLERLPAGWGILCDDLMAGVYANIAGQALWRFTPIAAWLSGS